jgi:uncharacterized DUF497 family protein
MAIRFEWDEYKAAANLIKHRVSFDDASLVFFDPLALSEEDRIDEGEQRWRTIGMMDDELLLVVIHVFRHRDGIEKIRIISARKAQPHERRRYENENG